MRSFWFLLIPCSIWIIRGGGKADYLCQDTPTLRKVAPFPIGVAVDINLLSMDSLYRNTVEREFSSITSENALKMNRLHVAPNRYEWSGGDLIVDFASQTNKRMHGHTLVWHEALPTWVTLFKGDSVSWENLLKNHIQTVIRHYKGRVKSWDVANEVFDEDGLLRKTIWLEHLGPDYIARCYQYAHEADPDALLFYNDSGQESNSSKREAIKSMLLDFKARKIPIHGIGLQSHITIYNSENQFKESLIDMASTGLLVHISELDIRLNPRKVKGLTLSNRMLEKQELKYTAIVKAYKAVVPKNQQYGITLWNVSDKNSYVLNKCKCPDAPLLFDNNYKKKLSYKGLINGLRQ